MPSSLFEKEVRDVLTAATHPSEIRVRLPGQDESKSVTRPFTSPVDWRDQWIYFIMLDRFNNPKSSPRSQWDLCAFSRQGGTFEGVRAKLGYLNELGVGAIWVVTCAEKPAISTRREPSWIWDYGFSSD